MPWSESYQIIKSNYYVHIAVSNIVYTAKGQNIVNFETFAFDDGTYTEIQQ